MKWEFVLAVSYSSYVEAWSSHTIALGTMFGFFFLLTQREMFPPVAAGH